MGLSTRLPLLLTWACLAITGGVRSAGAGDAAPPQGRPQEALDSVARLQDAFALVAERVAPSVVCITSYVREEAPAQAPVGVGAPSNQWRESAPPLYPGFRKLHSGSGLMLGAECHILTLHQLVTKSTGEPADVVDVETQQGRHIISRVVGLEPTLNLAVLEFVPLPERQRPECVPVAIGDSDSMRVGYWTFALGDPSGPSKAFSPGFLSGFPEKRCYQEQLTATYLQAALKLHPEAYGGPLVNIRGEVVGITIPRTLRPAFDDGLEYALPINVVMPIYQGICANKSFRSPWLGIAVLEIGDLRERFADAQEFRSLLRPRLGVYIEDVFDPSPASRADIRVGDFLVSFNGQRLFSVYRFQEQLHLTGIGRTGKLEIFRAGQILLKEVVVEARPEAAKPQ